MFGVLPTDKLAQLFELYRKYDGDEDGALSFTEFCGMWLELQLPPGEEAPTSPLKEGGEGARARARPTARATATARAAAARLPHLRRRPPHLGRRGAAHLQPRRRAARSSGVAPRSLRGAARRRAAAARRTPSAATRSTRRWRCSTSVRSRALRTAPHLYEEQLQELFDLVDLDKTGTIDVNEGAGALIQAVGDVYLNRSMQKASSIDVHDAAALPALLRALPAASRLMMLVDDDDDCALDQKEFANGLRLLARAARALGDEGLRAVAALPAERTRLNRMFAKADINGDASST